MSNPVSEKYLNSVCKVRSMENILLTAGHIVEITNNEITIRNESDLPNIIQFNKTVRLSILNDKLGFLTVIGTVFTCTTKLLKLVDLKEVNQFEKRSFFRLGVALNGIITYPVESEAEDPTKCVSHKVVIQNVSLSGVLFTSTFPLQINDRISIQIFTPFGKLVFNCRVCRIVLSESGENHRYGCEFDKYPEKAGDALWKYMLLKEREDIRRAKGDW